MARTAAIMVGVLSGGIVLGGLLYVAGIAQPLIGAGVAWVSRSAAGAVGGGGGAGGGSSW